ncbi:hypothetical protein QBC47DRAFT_392279 [Echria macrotheca]|uniref:Fungal N-terminal domain-containing protein n=1 Tax=Echria macrotheca TaxID=438768 RepID=A0AAJ0F7F2_9PEZI|nr:hypothetical protein QBC47DRAFT_392279 [Echria macrotheca]
MASTVNTTDAAGCVSLDCSDSALSVTGNVIGILTFALAAIASLGLYIRTIRDSEGELREARMQFRKRLDDLRRLIERVNTHFSESNGMDIPLIGEAMGRLIQLVNRATKVLHEIDGKIQGGWVLDELGRSSTMVETFRGRARFII